MNTKMLAMRLAFRVEGNWWVAYMARPDTMDGATKLGSILMGVVADPVRKRLFMDLMTGAMRDAITHVTGSAPTSFEVQGAPEAERAGRA